MSIQNPSPPPPPNPPKPPGSPAPQGLVAVGAKPPAPSRSFLPRTISHMPRLLPRAEFADFLPEIEAVAEREHSPLARTMVIALSIMFAVALAWAAIAEVDRVASAESQVRPFGRVKVINHPDGGIVTTLNVHEGQMVHEGDVLIEIDPAVIEQELAKANAEYLTRSAEVARLTAEVTGGKLEFPAEVAAERPDLIATQTKLFNERAGGLDNKRNAAAEVVLQKQSEAAGLTAQIGKLEESLVVLQEQERATSTLADKGYFPRLKYLSIKRELAQLEGQIAQAKAQLTTTRAALQEAMSKRDALNRDAAAEPLDKLVTSRRDRDAAYRTLQQNKSRLNNLVVRAPVDGVVQKLTIGSPGQAIRPGEAVMNIVPTGASLIVEAKVSNNDIGYIQVGQEATVKILTYDYMRYGTLQGVVETIPGDAIEDEKTREYYFPVIVRTEKNYLGDKPGQYPVQPGMQAEVDFKLGKRTILEYLTERMLKTTNNAFKER
ncbi:MAG: HlyD family type I secretion periplasmic adaptor subunit [Alphaproteobacteria bacterium]